MSDLYYELLVKKKKTGKDTAIQVAVIAAIILLGAGGLFGGGLILLIPAIAAAVAAYIFLPRLNREYEYLFVNGEMDIDVIYSREKRKKMKSFNFREAEVVAPLKSHELDHANNNKDLVVYDFSSGIEESKNRYAALVRIDEKPAKIIFEPDERLLKLIRETIPSKFKNY